MDWIRSHLILTRLLECGDGAGGHSNRIGDRGRIVGPIFDRRRGGGGRGSFSGRERPGGSSGSRTTSASSVPFRNSEAGDGPAEHGFWMRSGDGSCPPLVGNRLFEMLPKGGRLSSGPLTISGTDKAVGIVKENSHGGFVLVHGGRALLA